jgi:hypothetical protein
MKKARLTAQDLSNLTRQRKSDAISCSSRLATYKESIVTGVHHYHDRNIQQRYFNVGDMVLQRIQDETGLHKLNLRLEGPFIMHKVTGPGSYRLQCHNGQEVPNSWSIEHLRCFHP